MHFFYELAIFCSAKKWRRHFFSTLHPLSTVNFVTATVLALVLLHDSRFNFNCYTAWSNVYSEIGLEVCCDLLRLLARKITKRIHSSKPASVNRPIWSQPPAWQWRWKQSLMSGLSQEVTVRPHMPSCLQIQWACYKKQRVEWEAKSGLCQWQTSTFKNFCGCTAMDMPEWRDMTKQIDWWAKQSSQVVCISEDLKCWKA